MPPSFSFVSALPLPLHPSRLAIATCPTRMQNETPPSTQPPSTQPAPEPDSKPSSTPSPSSQRRYSLQTRLREETEAPFRKARMFVYAGSAVSAGVGTFISLLRILAALMGVSGTQPLNETLPNVGINLGVIAVCALLLRSETKAGEKRLKRMSRAALIGALKVEDRVTGQVLQLKDLRGKKRIVLLGGKEEDIERQLSEMEQVAKELEELDVVVVPFGREGTRYTARGGEWEEWREAEGGSGVVIVRLDGRVGGRATGIEWRKFVGEIRRLPKSDKYGKP